MIRMNPVRQLLLATVAFLLLALPGMGVSANPNATDAPGYALFAATEMGQEFRPLDPLTLEDLAGGEPLAFEHVWPDLAVSADGSTFVTIDTVQGPLDDWIVVHDGIGGAQRLTIDAETALFNPRLSADGARLVVEPTIICGPSGCGERVWYTYDTHSGELVSTVRVDVGEGVWPDLLDPSGERLYYPFHARPPLLSSTSTPEPGSVSAVGPWPLQIAAYDLETGQEIDTVTVPEVDAGSWQAEPIEDMYVGEMLLPAIALSPDGTRIAVVDAAVERLTLLDAGTLEVVATRSIHEPESVAQRVLGWLGLAPETAQAKISEGRSIRATWAADGQHLYVTGHEMEVGDTIEEITGHGLGLMRIDVDSGEITGEALAGHDAEMVIPAPDGRSVYVLRPEVPWWDNPEQSWAYVLLRLDAGTLAPLAEREYPAWPRVMLAPVGPTS